ncbi:MAG: DUF1648 domain-containing protein [Microbacteriaceae bacterium]
MSTQFSSKAYTTPERTHVAILALGIPVVVALIGVVVALSWLDELPDPVAIHWGADGSPDGFGPVATLLVLLPIIAVIFGSVLSVSLSRMLAVPRRSWTPKALVATSVWLSIFLTTTGVGSLSIQRGLDSATQTGPVTTVILTGLSVSIVPAIAAFILTPWPHVAEMRDERAPTLTISDNERVFWTQSIAPSLALKLTLIAVLGLTASALVLVLLVGTPANLFLLTVPAAVVLAVAATMFWSVRVDSAGLHLRSSTGIPRLHYPLADMTEAHVVQVSAFGEFGGWGIRLGGQGRLGIIIRQGKAIEVSLKNGRNVVVTVDDADTGVAVINGLLQRTAEV